MARTLVSGSVVSDAADEAVLASSKFVLVVEDDPIVTQIIQDILDSMGVDVITATNAGEALRVFGEHFGEITCVILDYGIPGMDASRLLNCLRDINSEVKVLLSSGYPKSFVCADIPLDSIDGFIPKPYEPQELISELTRITVQ